jgi:uncharacterized protein YggE
MNTQSNRLMGVLGGAVAVALVLAALLLAWTWGQSGGPARAQTPATAGSQITVRGSGTVNATPDLLKLTVGAAIQDSTVAAAQDRVTAITEALVARLQAAGIEAKDYRTAQYNVEPVMDYGSKGEPNAAPQLIGFRVTNLLELTLRAPEKAPALLDSLVAAGANTLYVQGYTFSDPAALRQAAYEAAMADAATSAARLASLSGLTLGTVVSVSDAGATGPVLPVDKGGMGGGSAAMGAVYPGQQTVQVDVVVTYAAAK